MMERTERTARMERRPGRVRRPSRRWGLALAALLVATLLAGAAGAPQGAAAAGLTDCPTLQFGMSNSPCVGILQQDLNDAGANPKLAVDRDFGAATRTAVMAWQRNHPPLQADGVAGPQTKQSLINALSVQTPKPAPQSPTSGGRQATKTRTLSPEGKRFIADNEGGLQLRLYDKDGGGNCTIGYGHLVHSGRCSAADHQYWDSKTAADFEALFQQDIERYSNVLRKAHGDTPLTQQEFDALVDFAFNYPEGVTGTHTLSLDLAATPPRYAAIPEDLKLYVYTSGKRSCGLYARRISEGHLFSTGSYQRQSPRCPF